MVFSVTLDRYPVVADVPPVAQYFQQPATSILRSPSGILLVGQAVETPGHASPAPEYETPLSATEASKKEQFGASVGMSNANQ